MQKPAIHLNGSSPRHLADRYMAAHNAVNDAMHAMESVWPHGRDYYPLGPIALIEAMKEHKARFAKLQEVANELNELAWHCIEAIDRTNPSELYDIAAHSVDSVQDRRAS